MCLAEKQQFEHVAVVSEKDISWTVTLSCKKFPVNAL